MADIQPLISAIVPVYNKGAYLAEAIASLDQQDVPEMEVVIVDDGSTDDSRHIVDQIPRLFPHMAIRCYHKPNGGVSDARNFGITRSTAPFILNMDADDIMLPGFLRQAAELVTSGADVVYSDLELFGAREGEWVPAPYDPYYIRYDNCVPGLALYRRSLWEQIGGYDVCYPFNEDWNFFVAAGKLEASFQKIPGKYFRYRQTNTGLYHSFIFEAWQWGQPMLMTGQSEIYQVEEAIWALQKLTSMPERWYKKFIDQNAIHQGRWLLNLWLGVNHDACGDAAQAIEYYRTSVNTSQCRQWLPLFKLAQSVESIDPSLSVQAYHRVRILRPDAGRIVNVRINELTGAAKGAPVA